MLVFLSWSGATSKMLAEILSQWLPSVIQAVKTFYSPDDVASGARWNQGISKHLEDASIGLICLTRESVEAPWVMFEAGALSKNIDKSKVCPILFGVEPTDIKGPLIQFQAAKFDRDGIWKVLLMINAELGDQCLDVKVLENTFEMWWPKLAKEVDDTFLHIRASGKGELRSDRELLEEVLSLSRTIQSSPHFKESIQLGKLENVYDRWVREVRKSKIGIGTILSECSLVGGKLLVLCPDDYHFSSIRRHGEFLKSIFGALTGLDLDVIPVQVDPGQTETPPG